MRRALVGLALVALTAACGTNQRAEAGPMAADTARGIVEVAGAEPVTRVVLRTPAETIALGGDPTEALRRASGIEVWVSGTRAEDGRLHVEAYRVRAVDGVDAADGVLAIEGDGAVLITATGDRLRFAPAPPGLRDLAGRHVWIAGPPGGEPGSWGVLDRP